MTVIADLDIWGPKTQRGSTIAVEQAETYCRELARVALRELPCGVVATSEGICDQHFCNVYAYCRWADDLGDEAGDTREIA